MVYDVLVLFIISQCVCLVSGVVVLLLITCTIAAVSIVSTIHG